MTFDTPTRTLFVLASNVYKADGVTYSLPAIFGYRIKQSRKIGDINRDGYVNVGDLQALVAAWGSMLHDPAYNNGPSPNWNPDADLNGDGYVNVGDLQPFVAHWGD